MVPVARYTIVLAVLQKCYEGQGDEIKQTKNERYETVQEYKH